MTPRIPATIMRTLSATDQPAELFNAKDVCIDAAFVAFPPNVRLDLVIVLATRSSRFPEICDMALVLEPLRSLLPLLWWCITRCSFFAYC